MLARLFRAIAILLVAGALTSCVPDQESWSPNGRYLAFVHTKTHKLWLWDVQRQQGFQLINDELLSCRFASTGELFFMKESDDKTKGEGVVGRIHMDALSGEQLPDSAVERGLAYVSDGFIDISSDGQYLYTARKIATGAEHFELVETHMISPGQHEDRTLLSSKSEMGQLSIDATRKRMLYVSDNSIALLDMEAHTTRSLVRAVENTNMQWPRWAGANDVVFVYGATLNGAGNDKYFSLSRLALDSGSTRTLAKNVYPSPPTIGRDGKTVYAAGYFVEDIKEFGLQIAAINVESGAQHILTHEMLGAGFAQPDPAGRQLAYAGGMSEQSGNAPFFRIMDLASGHHTTLWTNDEERLYADGSRFAQDGAATQAIASWHDLVTRFPKSAMRTWAFAGIAALQGAQEFGDLDAAYDAYRQIEGSDTRGLIELMLWPAAAQLAKDPADDQIRTYGTDASEAEFKFKTDGTRDLLGLSARVGDKYVYFKIDYASGRDLDGVTFQDTELLFDNNSPEKGDRTISPLAQWDRGAERRVLIRAWSEREKQSIYSVDILNETGERISHFDASGFAPARFADFDAPMRIDNGDASGSLVIAISREALDLAPNATTFVQVCTFKGGIEEAKHLERPREKIEAGKSQCDVADAFGEANSAERIDADLAAGKPAVIRGYAAKITAPPPPSVR